MAYYRNYKKFRSRYTKPVSAKTNKEKIINLKLEEFESLEIKYQTFSYDKLLLEKKKLQEKIDKNYNFVKENSLYIQNIIEPSLRNKKDLLQRKTKKINFFKTNESLVRIYVKNAYIKYHKHFKVEKICSFMLNKVGPSKVNKFYWN